MKIELTQITGSKTALNLNAVNRLSEKLNSLNEQFKRFTMEKSKTIYHMENYST